ncbi:sensor histidine kinase [Castellaniella sp.]|uniref:sensor histidine kinase n=1 Tax=Castellaniella sp. TaxID=1955812 RepID=UPI002AFE6EA2|nr:sensor histidine kinase [Castellaniella sp.]
MPLSVHDPLALLLSVIPENSDLDAAVGTSLLFTGLYTGFFLATSVLNLVAGFVAQRTLHVWFALFVASTGMRWFAVDGLAAGFLTDDPGMWWVANALLGAQMVTGSLCQIHLLELRKYHPLLLRYYQYCGIVPGLLIMALSASPVFDQATRAMFIILLPALWLSIPAYLRLWRDGSVSGRCIALALPFHFLVMLPATLGNIGLIPFLPAYIDLARYASLPVILALHAGIGLKVRALERERNEAGTREAQARATAEMERYTRQEQERVISVLTHEVRTPVSVIDMATYSLSQLDQDGPASATLRAARYHSIRSAVGRLRNLMELIEAMEHLRHTKIAAPREERLDLVNLSAALRNALDLQTEKRVEIRAADTLPTICGNSRLMHIGLSNLLDNAIKYAYPDTPIQIDIVFNERDSCLLWRIRDVGPGIPPEQQEAVFERYHRLDEASGKPGLGLGLMLARQIIEQHGGTLRLEYGNWSQGACFVVALPKE